MSLPCVYTKWLSISGVECHTQEKLLNSGVFSHFTCEGILCQLVGRVVLGDSGAAARGCEALIPLCWLPSASAGGGITGGPKEKSGDG